MAMPEAIRWLHTAAKESIEFDPAVGGGPVGAGPRTRGAGVDEPRDADGSTEGLRLVGPGDRCRILWGGNCSAPTVALTHSDLVRLFLARALISQGRGAGGACRCSSPRS